MPKFGQLVKLCDRSVYMSAVRQNSVTNMPVDLVAAAEVVDSRRIVRVKIAVQWSHIFQFRHGAPVVAGSSRQVGGGSSRE